MIKEHWEAKDLFHYYKLRFLIANLYRKDGDKLPHASYHNRGEYKRFMKIRMREYRKVVENNTNWIVSNR